MSEAAVPSGKWSNVPARIGTALAIAAVVLVFLWAGGWWWAGLIALGAGRIAYEWARMSNIRAGGVTYNPWQLVAGVVAVVFVFAWLGWSLFLLLALAAGVVGLLLSGQFRASWAGIGPLYIIGPAIAAVWLRNGGTGFDTPGAQRVLFVILVVVAADIGAYFSGKTIGGPKFIPRLSPNKTWAGFAGGLVAGALLGGVLAELGSDDFFDGVLVGLVLVVAAVAGDFLESGFKRHFGVKDTGGILPGHGGVLDRVDSHMAALTVAAVVIALAPGLSPV